MKRSDISGFEFTVCGYTIEVVTIRHIPRVLAVWRGQWFVWRVEV